jgi:DNA-binding FadR family transcriptional regulator
MRVPKIAELIADQIRDQIGSRRLREGDRLPSEPVLMTTFGASRPSVREALRILESDGLITVRRGVTGGGDTHAAVETWRSHQAEAARLPGNAVATGA